MNNPVAVLDEAYRFGPPTLVDVTTSQPTNADSAPTWQVYEDGSPMAGQSGTLSLLDSETGVYEGSFTPTAAAGFDPGKDYTLLIEAQVDGVVGKHKIGFVVGERLTQQLVADAMRIDGSGAPTADSVYAFASAAYTAAAAGASNAGSAATAATAVQAKLPAGGQSMAGATDLAAKASQASVNALPTAASVRQEMDANSTKLAKLDANVSDAVSAAEAVQTKLPSGGQTIAGADDLAAKPTAAQIRTEMDANSTKLANLDQPVSEVAASGVAMARVSRPAGKAYQLTLSDRSEGYAQVPKPARVTAGPIDDIAVSIDVAPVYGEIRVKDVGTPVVSAGTSLTCTKLGPRDEPGNPPKNMVMVELGGSMTAGEEATVTVPFTMETEEEDSLTFTVKALGS